MWNISLAIKESLRIDIKTQYKHHQINNAIKKSILPKDKLQYIFPDWLFDTIVSMSPRLISPLLFRMRNEQIGKKNISKH